MRSHRSPGKPHCIHRFMDDAAHRGHYPAAKMLAGFTDNAASGARLSRRQLLRAVARSAVYATGATFLSACGSILTPLDSRPDVVRQSGRPTRSAIPVIGYIGVGPI